MSEPERKASEAPLPLDEPRMAVALLTAAHAGEFEVLRRLAIDYPSLDRLVTYLVRWLLAEIKACAGEDDATVARRLQRHGLDLLADAEDARRRSER